MENTMWNKVIVVLAAISTIASMVIFAILVASMISVGVTNTKILGLVGMILSVLISSIILGISAYSGRKQRQKVTK